MKHMKRLIVDIARDERYSVHSGLALVGLGVNRFTSLAADLAKVPSLIASGGGHADAVRSYLGILSLGKSDYRAIEQHRSDAYFRSSLGIHQVPSEAALGQLFDEYADKYLAPVSRASVEFLKNAGVLFTPLDSGHVALDFDVVAADGSPAHPEKGSTAGQAPFVARLANEGWLIHWELGGGARKVRIPFIQAALSRVRQVYQGKVLVRKDSAWDAPETLVELSCHELVDYIVGWGPGTEEKEVWRHRAFSEGKIASPRPGKRVAFVSTHETLAVEGESGDERRISSRLVVRVTERETNEKGHRLITPKTEVVGWWTSLALPEEQVVGLYSDHDGSDQYHAELSSDMNLEKLSPGKYATRELVVACAALSYNILRFIGQLGLMGNRLPVRQPAKRRRIKSVIQELISFG